MKLLTRTGIWYLALSLALFVLAGFVFFHVVRADIEEDFTENLYLEKDHVIQFAEDSLKLPQVHYAIGDQLEFKHIGYDFEEVLSDTLLYNAGEEENQLFRRLTFPLRLGNEKYAVTILKALYETDDLADSIVFAFAIIALCTLLMLFVLNWWLSKRLWQPFYSTLQKLSQFELHKNEHHDLPSSSIIEFNTLNSEINKLTEKVSRDYRSLKEFSENASHEIQTPLAIVRAKLELLINQNNLSEAQLKLVSESYEAINRLSKLNQSLLVLSKIDNRQFYADDRIDFTQVVREKLEDFSELMQFRGIQLKTDLNPVQLNIHPYMAEILLSNLIGNAIKHNRENGCVSVQLSSKELVISNIGDPSHISSDDMFRRFVKSGASGDGCGLGLAIVKSICDACHIEIIHDYSDDTHSFRLQF
ncbi:MAG: HAMP domain-containing sensor histidine kinase [Flavobacteriales bacterium]|nr:HAMP domain-containing sensor histidine kinase [Flavobacteriales bacterium]